MINWLLAIYSFMLIIQNNFSLVIIAIFLYAIYMLANKNYNLFNLEIQNDLKIVTDYYNKEINIFSFSLLYESCLKASTYIFMVMFIDKLIILLCLMYHI